MVPQKNRFDNRRIVCRNKSTMDPGRCRRGQRTGRERGTSFRDGRNMADLETDKRENSCDRLFQCFQDNDV